MAELTIVIPSRNEMFLAKTIQDILAHIEGDTEIIAVLDGQWADPQIDDHERVTLVYSSQPIGQRAAVNYGVRMSTSKYVMKCDAHCAFDKGFDVKMMAAMQDDWTMVPIMRNLHVFDWVCPNGHRRYQGPSGVCKECGEPTTMDVVWIAKNSPQSTAYCFDAEPHFQYFGEFKKRPEGQGPLSETMSLQGSCFMMTRERYLDLDVCDESLGFWGSQGIEVACKSWLSGGKVMVNHNTWYAHCFRTQGGDFSFPYPLGGRQVDRAKKSVRELFFNDNWPGQVRPLSWLVERFWPVPGWTDEDLAKIKINVAKVRTPPSPRKVAAIAPRLEKSVVYYTDNRLDPLIMRACQEQIKRAAQNCFILSISLRPLDFGENIVLDLERGYLAMFRQILAGLEASTADIVFLCEHDVLYHPSHFDFVPPERDRYYYNLNCWKVDYASGHALTYTTKQLSQLCAYRELLLQHYRERVKRTEQALATMGGHEFSRFIRRQGFEPGSHGRSERVDDYGSDVWRSAAANIDIRHDNNLTPSRWRQDQFRDQRNCRDWLEADEVPGWGVTVGHIKEILEKAAKGA